MEQRFDPTASRGATIVNTAAVTTMYGPSGDWNETAVGGADPVGLRVELYGDRIRVSAHSFSTGGGTLLKSVDVAIPTDAEGKGKGHAFGPSGNNGRGGGLGVDGNEGVGRGNVPRG